MFDAGVVETAALSLTALGPSKIFISENHQTQTFLRASVRRGGFLSSLFKCLVLPPCENHQTLKWPYAENIARR
jgi:hypothetical protein